MTREIQNMRRAIAHMELANNIMDPKATLIKALRAMHLLGTGKSEEIRGAARTHAVEALRDLADWLDKGGFPPSISARCLS